MRQATDPDRTVREAGTAPVARASGVSRFAFDVPHNLSLGEPEPQRDQRGPELAAQVQRIALTIVVDESSERRFNGLAGGGAGVTGTAGATAGATAAAARGDETHPGGDHDRGRHCRNTGLAFAAAWGGRLARIGRSGRLGQLQRYVLPAFPDSHSMFPAIL